MEIGDVVYSRQYDARMTVNKIFEDGSANCIECQWWDETRFLRARFSRDELELVRENASH